jgi:hypothetical protein
VLGVNVAATRLAKAWNLADHLDRSPVPYKGNE